MGFEFRPSNSVGDCTPAMIILQAAATPAERYELTLTDLFDLFGAAGFTIETRRLLGINLEASQVDLQANQVRAYVAILTESDRDPTWPTIEDDRASIDAVFASRSP